jgi:4-hydroxy-tetrahydrodipicolinate synthase
VQKDAWRYHGVIPILPTPFLENDDVDFESLRNLVQFCKGSGVDGITILGVLGEANVLTDTEAREILKEVIDAAEGLPVIVGASRPGVRPTIDQIRVATEHSASVMIAPPSIEGIGEATVYSYFENLAHASSLPVIIQDHPASTRVHMSEDLIVRMIESLPAIGGLKCEAVPTAPKLRAIKARTQRVPILTGLGALYAATDLASGADGFNTGFAFPEVLTAMREGAQQERWSDMRAIYKHFLPLIVFEQHPGPAIRKEIWKRRGVLRTSRVRPPSAQINQWMSDQLAILIEEALGDSDIRVALSNPADALQPRRRDSAP